MLGFLCSIIIALTGRYRRGDSGAVTPGPQWKTLQITSILGSIRKISEKFHNATVGIMLHCRGKIPLFFSCCELVFL